jgi:cbb3-type cytochrome oxidase subunit 3
MIAVFIAIVAWVFVRKRKERFEEDPRIPFQEGRD